MIIEDSFAVFLKKTIVYIFGWYALWTIGANIVTFLVLPAIFLVVHLFVTSIVIAIFIWRFERVNILRFHVPLVPLMPAYVSLSMFVVPLVAFIAALTTALVLYKYKVGWVFMSVGVVLALVAFFIQRPLADSKKIDHSFKGSHSVLLWLLFTLFLSIIYLFGHQVDYDEANYLNLAIGAFRTTAGVFELDTMLGDGPTLIHLSTYKVQSYELLYGTLGYLLPGKTIFYAHIVLPLIFVVVFSGVLYLIYSSLFNRFWLIAALLHIAIMFLALGSLPSYGAHGLLRFFESKVIFIHIIAPLSAYQVLLWMNQKHLHDLIFLVVLQVSAVGMTANAIYAAPLSIGLAVMPFVLMNLLNKQKWIDAILVVFLGAAYPVFVAVMLLLVGEVYPSEVTKVLVQMEAIYTQFGWNLQGILMVTALLSFPLLIFIKQYQAYTSLYCLGLFLIIFNPILWPIFASVTGNLPFRVLWSTPFAFIFTIALSSVFIVVYTWLGSKKLLFYFFTVAVSLLFCLSLIYATSNKTIGIFWAMPFYKVNKEDYALAEYIIDEFPDRRCVVLVPIRVAVNLVMIENHPYPIAVRPLYQMHYRHTMPEDERSLRTLLLDSVDENGSILISASNIEAAIEQFGLDGVLIDTAHTNYSMFKNTLSASGYNEDVVGDLSLFSRPCI